jgi:PKD repeat protein
VGIAVPVRLDGSASTGATRFRWDFGDGAGPRAATDDPVTHALYNAPGVYRATLTVSNAAGAEHTDQTTVRVTLPPVHHANHDNTLAAFDAHTVLALSTDARQVVEIDADTLQPRRRIETCAGRRLAVMGQTVAVTCPQRDTVEFIELDAIATPTVVPFHHGAAPFGILAHHDRWYVSLQGLGAVAEVGPSPTGLVTLQTWAVAPDPRGISVLPDGRLAVTHWRSAPGGPAISVIDPIRDRVHPWRLDAHDGVARWLDQLVISPTSREAALPALLANVGAPMPQALSAGVTLLNPLTGGQWDAGWRRLEGTHASAAAWSPRGDYLYLALRNTGATVRLDRLADEPPVRAEHGGQAVEGLLVHRGRLWANAGLSRAVLVHDLALHNEATRIPLLDVEPLAPDVLRGKRRFNDARHAERQVGIACAGCHLDGDSDCLVWDWTEDGEGLRNTISLLGHAGDAHGPLNWAGTDDLGRDHAHRLLGPLGGHGLIFNADEPPQEPAELDEIAAYLATLDTPRRSPHRAFDGQLTEAAQLGAVVFLQAGCAHCHPGPLYTDSALIDGAPRLHDVGTIRATSGHRLGAPLLGLDTPSLLGLWDHAPFLHDGSAPDLMAVLTTHNEADQHGLTSALTPDEFSRLRAWLLSLDGSDR